MKDEGKQERAHDQALGLYQEQWKMEWGNVQASLHTIHIVSLHTKKHY